MSIVNTSVNKQPLKLLEVPINKFNEVVPHHEKIYEKHKTMFMKLVSANDVVQVNREVKDKKRIVKQLRDLMYELDTLRTQCHSSELDKFDSKTVSLRKVILNLISGYNKLEAIANDLNQRNAPEEESNEIQNPFEGAAQIQIEGSIQELKLKMAAETFNKVENINQDIRDLHEIYSHINEQVYEQREDVETIAECTESTQENVNAGVKHLATAYRYKAVSYPVTGAFLGGIIAGPIGMVAGLKVGSLAAVTFACAGYTGGKLFKKVNDANIVETEITDENHIDNETKKKKNI